MTKDQIRAIFMANGFTIKEGQTDLKDYVYAAAEALLAASASAEPVVPQSLSNALSDKPRLWVLFNEGDGRVMAYSNVEPEPSGFGFKYEPLFTRAALSAPASMSAENRGICSACNGSGFADATGLHACFKCNGDGAENRPAQDDVRDAQRIDYLERRRAEAIANGYSWDTWGFSCSESKLSIREQLDAAIASQSAKEPR